MNKLFLKEIKNLKRKSMYEEKPKQKKRKFSIIKDYSTPKFSSGIGETPKFNQNLNLLISQNYKSIFNPNSAFKKENSDQAKIRLNDLSNSNALMKTTEENLISNVNNETLISKNSNLNKTNRSKRRSIKKSDTVKNKLEGTILKNAINFFNNKLKSENDEEIKHKSSTKILSNKLLEDIEKEKNKIISHQRKRKSAFFSNFNNITNNLNVNPIFKFGEIKKKKKSKPSNRSFEKSNNANANINNINNNNKNLRRRRLSIFSGRESMQIKSLREVGLQISNTISKISVREMKKEIRELETSEISKIIEKYPTQQRPVFHKRASLEQTTLFADLSRFSKEVNLAEYREKFRSLFVCKNLYDSLDEDEYEDSEKSNIYYIGPNTISCYIIDSFILIATVISLFYIPLFLGLILTNCKFHFFSGINLLYFFIDLVYLIDLITGFFRAFYNFDEVLIVKKRYMILNYLKGSFLIDLIEAIPYFMILNAGQEDCNKKGCYNFAFTNNLKYSFLILKILKIIKIPKNSAWKAMDKFLSKSNFFSDWEALLINVFFIICSLHLVSCYLIFIGKNVYPGWIVEAGLLSSSFGDRYVAAIYYVMTTLTTVGYGDVPVTCHIERLFQIFNLIVGTIAYSWLLTYISNYIKKNNEKYKVYEEKLKILEEIKINYPNLDTNLYERLVRYLNYNKSKYKYDVKYVLDSLPSSIQNNLIIEIYKPIIKNFQFFKYLENSDFFVKIVTSMKPILAMKGDILVHEGDVIEDIIFIKKGILSLDIGINLYDTKKFIDDYLNTSQKNNNAINHLTSQLQTSIVPFKTNATFFSLISTNTKKFDTKIIPKKYIKIIDLRKNEHFGDALMILNEKSPVTIKVRTKNAELLFLQKTDATEISNVYPNIWKRIVNKSLFNMKQIKNMAKKKVILYCELNDIEIDPHLKKKYIGNLPGSKKVSFDNNVDFNFKSSKKKEKIKSTIKSIIPEVDESKFVTSMKNSTISKKGDKKSEDNSSNSKKNSSKKNLSKMKKDSSSLTDEEKNKSLIEEDNKNKKTMVLNENKKKIENNNNRIDTGKIFEIIQNNINSILEGKIDNNNKNIKNYDFKSTILAQKECKSDEMKKNKKNRKASSKIKYNSYTNNNPEDKSLERVNEEQYFNEDFDTNILNKHIIMDNFDKNNFIYHQANKVLETKENSYDSIFQNNNFNKINKLLSDGNTSDINYEKLLIDNKSVNTNDRNNKINIYNNIVINNSNKNDNGLNDNYNKPNKFLYLQNSSADSFSINSTYENINKISKYIYASNPILRQKTKKFLIQNSFARLRTVQMSKSSKNITNESIIREKTLDIKSKKGLPRSAEKPKNEKSRNLNGRTQIVKHKLMSFDNSVIKRQNTQMQKKKGKRNKSSSDIGEAEGTFYAKFQEINSGKKTIRHKDKNKEKDKDNYEEQISKNIENNKQNLNNPEEYYSGFFNKLLSKKNVKK